MSPPMDILTAGRHRRRRIGCASQSPIAPVRSSLTHPTTKDHGSPPHRRRRKVMLFAAKKLSRRV